MKRILIAFLILALLTSGTLIFSACNRRDHDGEETSGETKADSGHFEFSQLSDGSYGIKAAKGADADIKELEIPAEHNGQPVTAVMQEAFSGFSSLESINMPASLKEIGSRAFADCSALKNVNIPSTVERIGFAAFAGCSVMTEITVPFVGAEADGVGNQHFGYIFGASGSADNGNKVPATLKKVTVRGGSVIGEGAFAGCAEIEDISLPQGLVSVSRDAFENCAALTFTVYKNGRYLGNAENAYLCLYEVIDKNILSVQVHNSASVIAEGVFVGNVNVEELILPDGLTSIGFEAFKDCANIKKLVIPSGVKTIGEAAFIGCVNLEEVTIGKGVEIIGEGAFHGCSSLKAIVLPEGVREIGNHVFQGCASLASVTLPKTLNKIGSFAFYGCTSLKTLTIPENVTFISIWAFQNCTGLKEVTFEVTEGWTIGNDPGVPSELANKETAAKYLSETYYFNVWSRK